MAIENNVAQIVLRGTLNGQEIRNVFFYNANAPVGGSALDDLGIEFEDLFFGLPDIGLRQECFSNQMTYTGLRVTDLFNPVLLYDTVFSSPYEGGTSAQPLPPFNCVGFKSTQVRADVRSGQKRFAGVIEDAVENGFINVAFDADLDDLAVKLGTPIITGDATWTPIIVKRILETPTPPALPFYRLPETNAEGEAATALEWSTTRLITSQNTRKIGRGI